MVHVTDDKRLQNAQEVYDYFAAHPGGGVGGLANVLCLAITSVRYRVGLGVARGYIRRAANPNYHGHGDKFVYYVTGQGRPTEVPIAAYSKRGNPTPNPMAHRIVRRIVPAKQIGMHRDPFDALFFGPARAEVQA